MRGGLTHTIRTPMQFSPFSPEQDQPHRGQRRPQRNQDDARRQAKKDQQYTAEHQNRSAERSDRA